MASYTDYRYAFNGVVSTNKTVMQNMDTMCTSAGSWLAYDIHSGKWSIIINKAGTSVASFNDSNIIGPITVSGTGLTALYNKVKVQFPHIDLNQNSDYIQIEIPALSRNSNEPDNTLQMQLDVINDPVQAQLIGGINLKQSRVDKTIRFVSDFSKLGVKAGDLIDITSPVYGFSSKMFRITSIIERDADDGTIQLDITGLEYDANVYDTSDLSRYEVSNQTGIVSIGSIGMPGTPTIDKIEINARPHVTVHTSSPTGIVEAVEFWTTTDVPPGNNVDSTRNYTLIGTVRPAIGAVFAYGTSVSLSVDSLISSNFLVKTRGINSKTSGPYSTPSAFIYTPVQVTNAIGPDTIAVDGLGALVTTLGVTYLLNHLDDVWKGISTPGSIFDKLNGIFTALTGTDPVASAILNGPPTALETFEIGSSQTIINNKYNAFSSGVAWGTTGYPGDIPNDDTTDSVIVGFQVDVGMKQMLLILQTPLGSFSYDFKDESGSIITRNSLYAYFPSMVRVYKDGVLLQTTTVDWQTQTSIMQIESAGPGFYEVRHFPLLTYDLNQKQIPYIHPYNFSTSPQASGYGSTVTAYMFR